MIKSLIPLIFLFPVVLLADANAESQKLESKVSVFVTGDSYNGRGGGLDLDLGFEKTRLLFGTSLSRNKNDDEKTERVQNYYVGFGTDPLKRYSMTVTADYWGIKKQFETRSLNPTFYLRSKSKKFIFNVTPGLRSTKIYTDPNFTTKKDYRVFNPYLTLGLNYISHDHWIFKAEGSKNWYDADLDVLGSNKSNLIFSPTTLNLSDSFQTSRLTLGIGHIFNLGQVTLEGTRSKAEVDDIISKTLALKTVFFVQYALDVGLTVGSTKTSEMIDGNSRNNYLELNMTYYW